MPRFPGFIGGSYHGETSTASNERSVNWYPRFLTSRGAKGPMVLVPTPGVRIFADDFSSRTPCRGVFFDDGLIWTVMGDTLFRVTEDGAVSTVGVVGGTPVIATDRWQPVSFAATGSGGDELLVTSGRTAYLVDKTAPTAVTAVMLPDSANADDCAMINGFFIVLDRATSTLWSSRRLDGTMWPGDFLFQRTSAPDPWQSVFVTPHDQVWVIGARTTDVLYDPGTQSAFPLLPISGSVMNSGTAHPDTVDLAGPEMCWLEENRDGGLQVVAANSQFSPLAISPPEVSYRLSKIDTSEAVGFRYQAAGHLFYCLSFPRGHVTWVYDFTTQFWHERTSLNRGRERVWQPAYVERAFSKTLCGTLDHGALYELTDESYVDVNNKAIRRVRQLPHMEQERRRIYYSLLEIDLDRGVAPLKVRDPKLVLQFSNDGGKTWSPEIQRSAGNIGDYRQRVRFHRLGSAYDRVFRIICTDPIPWRLVSANIAAEIGSGG